MPRWILPAVLLMLLLVAFAFRWDEGSTKTFSHTIVEFKHDRWTGQNWVKVYRLYGRIAVTERAIEKVGINYPYQLKNGLTIEWTIATVLAAGWLLWSVRPRQPKGEERDARRQSFPVDL